MPPSPRRPHRPRTAAPRPIVLAAALTPPDRILVALSPPARHRRPAASQASPPSHGRQRPRVLASSRPRPPFSPPARVLAALPPPPRGLASSAPLLPAALRPRRPRTAALAPRSHSPSTGRPAALPPPNTAAQPRKPPPSSLPHSRRRPSRRPTPPPPCGPAIVATRRRATVVGCGAACLAGACRPRTARGTRGPSGAHMGTPREILGVTINFFNKIYHLTGTRFSVSHLIEP